LKKIPYPYAFSMEEDIDEELQSVASATECTGLMPSALLTEDEVNGLREIYDVPPGQRDSFLKSMENPKNP